MRTVGSLGGRPSPQEVDDFIAAELSRLDLRGRTLCLVIPDSTRSCPLPLLLGAIERATTGRVASCEAVIALGTHAPMSEEAIAAMVGDVSMPVHNHEWWEPGTFTAVGSLSSSEVSDLSGGLLDERVEVRLNRKVVDADVTIIVGPVLPHEVVGFSGGNKYLFPGLSGPELIDLTHWLGALITSREIIGTQGITPVRAFIEAAAELVVAERHALCVVVDAESGDVESLSFGEPLQAWAQAVEVAAGSHIRYLDAPVSRVLSVVDRRYDDLWTGAKGFYKVEPVVADGGEVVLFAPHITSFSKTHPGIVSIGYHCRDYFLAKWNEIEDVPLGELAHATHLFGAGTFDAVSGEHQRVKVTLATSIPEAEVRRANLGFLDPGDVDLVAWELASDALVVPHAGEVLYKLRAE
jgi:lactate racemase